MSESEHSAKPWRMPRLPTRWLVMSIAVALLTGCARNSHVSNFCLIYRVVYVTPADIITDETAEPILENNITWKRLCL